MSIIALIPFIQILVESIEPVRTCWKVGNLISRDIARNEGGNRMTDEHVGMLNIPPKELPDVMLR
jgi:hypothetical protein